MVTRAITQKVKKYLRMIDKSGLPVHFGIIFGSYAVGKTNKWNDIDPVIVSSYFDKHRKRRDIDLLWRLTTLVDNRIEPIPCGEKQWLEDDSSFLIEVARRNGKK